MADSQFLQVIRVWAALAWADGTIADAEASALGRLIQAADLSEEERGRAQAMLTTKVELDTSELGGLSADARKGIYRAACRLAAVDQHVAAGERSFLAKLREGLKLSPDEAAEIARAVPGLGD
ncbi:MAG: DUF533 domain-containing protein [Kofleriaceae bacterium]